MNDEEGRRFVGQSGRERLLRELSKPGKDATDSTDFGAIRKKG